MKKEEKTLHDHLIICHNLLFIGGAVMLSAILFQRTALCWIAWSLGFLIMIASVFYSAKFFRCPHCDTKLDPRRKVSHFCPNCGRKLD